MKNLSQAPVGTRRGAVIALLALLACGGAGNETRSPDAVGGGDGGAAPTTTDGGASPGTGDAAAPASDAGTGAPDAGPRVTDLVTLVGRVDLSDPVGARFAWPGSAIRVRFHGTGLDAQLLDSTAVDQLSVVVDGRPPVVLKLATPQVVYALAAGLPSADHEVTVSKRTETFFGTVQLVAVTPVGGALLPPPAPKKHKIEVIGDSITCGYGDEGVGPTCKFTPDTENETVAYGALTATALDADHAAVAWSGKGMVRNNDGTTTDLMPTLWGRTLADQPTSTWGFAWIPDVVVINLGTNDFAKGDPGKAFPDGYTAFLGTLRQRYPDAYIVCTLSPMIGGTDRDTARAYISTSVVDAARAKGDTRVSFLELDLAVAADGYGCDYHPSAATHAKMAAKLSAHIKTLTGW